MELMDLIEERQRVIKQMNEFTEIGRRLKDHFEALEKEIEQLLQGPFGVQP